MKILQMPFLQGITESEWKDMQACFGMHKIAYSKNDVIFHMGEIVHEIGIVNNGSVNIENVDLWGNKTILSNVSKGEVFAETYALCKEPMMVYVVAAQDCEVLFLDMDTLTDGQYESCGWQSKLLRNMLNVVMQKNLILSERIFYTTPKTIRGRLLIYLSAQSVRVGSNTFQIPFSRQQMADYLNLDRSALSKELGKMRDDGLIDFYKNTFRLLKTGETET